jgi:hypothetical protein
LNPEPDDLASITAVPSSNCAAQPFAAGAPFVTVQSIPAGELVTRPFPAPPAMVSVLLTREKLAEIVCDWLIVTLHGFFPAHTPPKPPKALLLAALAVSSMI